MPYKNQSQELVFTIFGNYERVRLLTCLEKPHTVTELLDKCTLSQSALSQHLAVLKQANMVHCVRDGKYQIYEVCNHEALKLAKSLVQFSLTNH